MRQFTVREIAARTVPAIAGGFVLANVTAIAVAAMMPLERGDAVMAAILMSFVFYCAAIVWSFAAPSAQRAWLGIAIWTAVAGTVALALLGTAT